MYIPIFPYLGPNTDSNSTNPNPTISRGYVSALVALVINVIDDVCFKSPQKKMVHKTIITPIVNTNGIDFKSY